MNSIQLSQEEQILLIKINRPEKYNARSITMYHYMSTVIEHAPSIKLARSYLNKNKAIIK